MKIRLLRSDADEQLQARKLVMEGFASKFVRVKLNDRQLMELTQLVWRFPNARSQNRQYVAEVAGQFAGTMSLVRENTSDEEGISLIQLGRQFGWANVMGLLTCYSVLEHNVASGEVYIDHIVSSPAMRGRGVGTRLLEMAKQSLGEGERLTLYVAESNPEAKKLYERLGFRVVKKQKSHLKKMLIGEEGWYFMEWRQE